MKGLLVLPVALAAVAGLALAGGQRGAVVRTVPLFSLCAAIVMIMQWLAFVPAYRMRTERFFDLIGSLTYLTVAVAAVALGPPVDARSMLLVALVVMGSARLGIFLFRRVRAGGRDGRFDEIKTSFAPFLVAWTLQGVWIVFPMGAALAVISSDRPVPVGPLAWLGLALWLTGFGIEVAADRQKREFRARPENQGRFIDSGLWAWSRHPNYFGEIVLWLGVAIIALPALQGWQNLTLISPVFVALLLAKGSGIPLLEERADAKWGGQEDYAAYRASTPVLVPRPPSSRVGKP